MPVGPSLLTPADCSQPASWWPQAASSAAECDGPVPAVPFAAIASLATRPENRRTGALRTLLMEIIDELRADAVPIATLYPFDRSFYHRFGWAIASQPHTVTLPTHYLVAKVAPDDSSSLVEVGRDSAPQLAELHSAWGHRYNLSIIRDDWWYQRYLWRTRSPQRYAYLYRNSDGTPEGYTVIYFVGQFPDSTRVVVRDLVTLTPAARRALLAMIGNQSSPAARAELWLPSDDPLFASLDRTRELTVGFNPHHGAMARILDVEAALGEWRNLDTRDSEVVVEIDDPVLEATGGRWAIAIREGESQVSRTHRPADVAASIHTITQICLGFVSPAAAVAAGVVSGPRSERIATLASFAGHRIPFHNDYY